MNSKEWQVVTAGAIKVGVRSDLVMAVARARTLRLRGYPVYIRRRTQSGGTEVVEISADLRALSRVDSGALQPAAWLEQVQTILDNINEEEHGQDPNQDGG